ncbi:MAG: recombinase RecT [Opitutaceae bacterium]|jgi:recombination protein RecT|nr:recombinase RecT [Opitutaceae bacterium]
MAENNNTNALAVLQSRAVSLLNSESTQEKIRALIPASMSYDRFHRLAVSLVHRNPKIAECETVSFFATLSDCATIGVYPDPVTGLAYIIPRWNSKKKVLEATLLVGYKGLRSISLRSPEILDLWTGVVRTGDTFKLCRAPRQEIIHEPLPDESGEVIGYYSIAQLRNGLVSYEWMPVAVLKKIRDDALSKLEDWQVKTSPWTLWEEEMGRKSVMRRHFKSLPLRPEDQEATQRELDREHGHAEPLDVTSSASAPALAASQEDAAPALPAAAPARRGRPPRSPQGAAAVQAATASQTDAPEAQTDGGAVATAPAVPAPASVPVAPPAPATPKPAAAPVEMQAEFAEEPAAPVKEALVVTALADGQRLTFKGLLKTDIVRRAVRMNKDAPPQASIEAEVSGAFCGKVLHIGGDGLEAWADLESPVTLTLIGRKLKNGTIMAVVEKAELTNPAAPAK